MWGSDNMIKDECGDCKHFIQHYVKSNSDYEEICCGSCWRSGKLIIAIHFSDVCRFFEPRDVNDKEK